MPRRFPNGARRAARAALAATAGLLAACSLAADVTPPRSGFVPTPRKTRDELVREWDLNSDGRIDQGEAEVAASRMRRERAELRLNSGIDPVTGLPRGEPPPEPEPADVEEKKPPADEPPADADRDDAKPLPGTRVPRTALPGTARTPADPRSGSAPAPARGTRAAADLKRQSLTGGVRAGGLPARPGYGADLPAAPLNAGLPIAPKNRPAPAPTTQFRGGLVPTPRPAAGRPPTRPAASRDMYDPH